MLHTVPNHYIFYCTLRSWKVLNLQNTYQKKEDLIYFASGENYRLMQVDRIREKSRSFEYLHLSVKIVSPMVCK